MVNLKILTKKTSNKMHAQVLKKLNNLSGEIKLLSTKGLTKDLINGYNILNSAKYFSDGGSQSHFVF